MGRDTDIDTLEHQLAEPNASLDALRDREAGYRTLFMTMGQGYSLLELVRDAQDRAVDMLFIELNPAAERLVGVAAADLVGKRLRAAFPETESVWWETYDTVARSGKPTSLEHYFAPTGRWYESFIYPAGGDRVFVMYEDTTVRKQAETALRESEMRQAFLLELSDVLRSLSDPVEVQTAALCVLGEHLGTVRAQYFEVEPDGEYARSEGGYAKEGPRVSGRVRLNDFGFHVIKALAAGSTVVMSDVTTDPLAIEEMLAAYDAVRVKAYVTVPLVKGGRLVALLSVHHTAARDWTSAEIALCEETAERTWAAVERARAEASARDSETRMRTLFGASPAPLLVLQADTPRFTITEVNDAYLTATMRTREDLVGRAVFEAFPDNPEDETIKGVSTLRASLERVLSFRSPDAMPAFRYDIARPDGTFEVRWWCPINSPVPDDTGQVGSIIHNANDVTEKYRADAALRDSEAQVADVLEGMSEGFVLLDRDFRIARINSEGLRIDGRPASELLGKTHWEAWPGSEEAPQGVLYKRLMRERASGTLEIEYDWPERRAWFETRIDPVRGGLAVFFRDVSERKAAESAVMEAEGRLRLATDNAEIGFWDVDMVADVLIWPPRTKAMFGISPHAPVSMDDFYAGLHPEDREATAAAYAAAADPDRRALYNVEYRTIGKEDGVVRWVAAKGRGVFDAEGRCLRVVGTAIDVTGHKVTEAALRKSDDDLRESGERLRLLEELALAQEALRQAQKMEAMGQLTGGVAHDFNNLLTPIVGSLDMLIRRGVGSERERRLIDGAMQSAERAKTLVQRLLAFARRQPLQPVAIDVAGLVHGMGGLLGSTLGPTIDFRVNVARDLPPAKADPNQLEMALLNLSVNARDAMPAGGTLTIAATLASVREDQGAKLKPGQYIRISVADTGGGMDAATLERAVEPFFSTKGVGRGTGLGLSMAHGLAAQLGGELLIDSAQGQGTTIALWLPVSAEQIGKADEITPPTQISLGRGLALLVDDEDLVRMSTADMLIDLGFEVVEAASAEEALRLMADGATPDLLVTDHLMPGLSGVNLAREARRLRPALPILIVSGYAEMEGLAPDLARLTKPFRNAELTASLAALLPMSSE